MALKTTISKSLFLNIIRCRRYFALHKLKYDGENADVSFSTCKSVADLFTLEYNEKIKSIIDSLSTDSESDSEDDRDETIATDQVPEIFTTMYTDIEKIASRKASELYPNSLIKSGKTFSDQFYASCEKDDITFYAFVDIYQETDDEIHIFEVKASTDKKLLKGIDNFWQGDDKIFYQTKSDKPKALYNRLGSDGLGRMVYDLSYQRYILENSPQFNPKHKKVRYFLSVLNGSYVHENKTKFFHYPTEYPTSIISVFDLTNVTKVICEQQLERDYSTVINRIRDSFADECKISVECQQGRNRECIFLEHCLKEKNIPEYSPFFYIGGRREIRIPKDLELDFFDLLDHKDYKHAENIEDSWLKDKQITQKHCLINDCQFVENKGIKAWINELKYPIYHLDFESVPFPLPRFNGEKCYSQSLFQFSVHIERKAGECNEETDNISFLAENHTVDQRYELARKLAETIKDDNGSIVTYNKTFEIGRLKELATLFPEFAEKFQSWINYRIVDLMHCVTPTKELSEKLKMKYNLSYKKDFSDNHFFFYDHHMKRSFSIKKVLPVFTTRSYSNLNVQNGNMAYSSFLKLVNLGKTDYAKLYNDMLTYCRLDTYSMFLILNGLRKFGDADNENI